MKPLSRLVVAMLSALAVLAVAMDLAALAQDSAEIVVAKCDVVSASPIDPDRPSAMAGVALDKLNHNLAIPACEAALRVAPNERRLRFQLGRAHEAAKQFDKARKEYETASAAGSLAATFALSRFGIDGLGGAAKDVEAGMKLLERAANAGLMAAMINLATRYENGTGIPKDQAKARGWREKAAAAGD